MKTDLVRLEDIYENYENILIDTCALFHAVGNKSPNTTAEKIAEAQTRMESVFFYLSQLDEGVKFFVTQAILNEYLPGGSLDYSKRVRKRLDREETLLLRMYKRCNSSRNKGGRLLEKELVLELSPEEQEVYDGMDNEYYEHLIKEPKLWKLKRKPLSETDYHALLSTAVLASKRKSVAIISNDQSIDNAWIYFLRREGICPDRLGFFYRETHDRFLGLRS